MGDLVDETYINTMGVEELRRELVASLELHYALMAAFKKLPEVPRREALLALSDFASYPRDMERGKAMQRLHGIEAVPPKTELEMGAGLWSIIRAGLVPDSQLSRWEEAASKLLAQLKEREARIAEIAEILGN